LIASLLALPPLFDWLGYQAILALEVGCFDRVTLITLLVNFLVFVNGGRNQVSFAFVFSHRVDDVFKVFSSFMDLLLGAGRLSALLPTLAQLLLHQDVGDRALGVAAISVIHAHHPCPGWR